MHNKPHVINTQNQKIKSAKGHMETVQPIKCEDSRQGGSWVLAAWGCRSHLSKPTWKAMLAPELLQDLGGNQFSEGFNRTYTN